MRKIYITTAGIFFIFLFSACSKDFLRSYENRIEGSWRLTDVDRNGIGGSMSGLPFKDGLFTFSENGQLEYVNTSGEVYKGSWDIRREWIRGNCVTGENNNNTCNDRNAKSLHITSVNFQTQEVRSEYFNEIIFTGTNRFKAYIHRPFHSFVFRFKRQ